MGPDEILFRKRLLELAERAYQDGRYLFTGFLSLAELDIFHQIEQEIAYVPATAFGGTADCERMMLRFGSAELCGYEGAFPIQCVEIAPAAERFGEELGHRDYLGALMNLGIERSMLGDIVILGKHAFLFCTDKMAPYILEQLQKVRHTSVRCSIAKKVPESTVARFERRTIQVNTARIDSIIAKLYGLSRSGSAELSRERRVFVNGRISEDNSGQLRPGDKVSVRGYGRFAFLGSAGVTRKGKQNIEVNLYH